MKTMRFELEGFAFMVGSYSACLVVKILLNGNEYLFLIPVSGKWNLAKDYLDYHYSSARFYETGVDEFGFLNNLFH